MLRTVTSTVQAIIVLGFLTLIVALVLAFGMVSFSGPSLPQFSEVSVDLSLPEEARIVQVEPIQLDCRARVFAEVPVEGRREHEAFGQVYRTDRITMRAYGDVDTCVDGTGTTVTHHDDGTTDVVIDADSIMFVRPRVDAVRTAATVDVDKDAVGKLVDAFPWVDDNLGLTPAAYAFAQNVIGSSSCMETAYLLTEGVLIDGYRDQAIEQGVDPNRLTVTIEGQPTFTDPDPVELGDVELWAGSSGITCRATGDLTGARSGL
ncbi:MAG: hypothetical protein AAFO29_10840 [Actinomycetota bacterium]